MNLDSKPICLPQNSFQKTYKVKLLTYTKLERESLNRESIHTVATLPKHGDSVKMTPTAQRKALKKVEKTPRASAKALQTYLQTSLSNN